MKTPFSFLMILFLFFERIFSLGCLFTLTPQEMHQDLEFLVKILENFHPLSQEGFNIQQREQISTARKKINLDEKLSTEAFFHLANPICTSFKDAHTNLSLPVEKDSLWLPLPIVWLDDGIIIHHENAFFQIGDKILSIEGKDENELLSALHSHISSENIYWIKSRAQEELPKKSFLKSAFNLPKEDKVNITFERRGKNFTKTLSFSSTPPPQWNHYKSEQKNPICSWFIENSLSLGIFELNSCPTKGSPDFAFYQKELFSFFDTIAKNKIKSLVLDLRENQGGHSKIVEEWLSYLDVDEYLDYTASMSLTKGVIQYYQNNFQEDPRDWTFDLPPYQVKNQKKETSLLFSGNHFVFTSSATFSSGAWLATVLQDNHIAKILGTPTGNAPSSYGDCISFSLPCSQIILRVSQKFTRPDPSKDPANSLFPDGYIPTTRKNITEQNDPYLEKVFLKKILSLPSDSNLPSDASSLPSLSKDFM